MEKLTDFIQTLDVNALIQRIQMEDAMTLRSDIYAQQFLLIMVVHHQQDLFPLLLI